ncbi:hypothetical protein FKM82_015429 [Ascaphus truei]
MLTQVHTRPLDSFPGHSPSTSITLRNVSSQRHSRSHTQKKTREKKSNFMGIDVCEYLHWQNWHPGKETSKNLTLKNVRLKTQKLKFSPPRTSFFSTLFPQSITLIAGTSFSLPITFRPLEKHDYEDSIIFETEEGTFSVALRATLPWQELLFPRSLKLPTCAVYDTAETSFVMRSAGDLQTPFRWEVTDPFVLTPASGVLEPKSEIRMKVLFRPQVALVHDVIATCRFGANEERERSIQLTSIAKYPHLLVSVPGEVRGSASERKPLLQFGPVGVGIIMEKHIEIHNFSLVDSPFRIERAKQASQVDCPFYCNTVHAVAPAQGKLRIPLQFRPRTVGMQSVDYFHVIPAGNLTKTVLKVTGSCRGPSMSLLKPVLNFGLVNLGEQILRTLEITNASNVPAHYQFCIDSSDSVFSFDRSRGTLGSWDTQSLQVTFAPSRPIPHYRRVACLIHNQDPLFLDLIGTCHSDEDKPAIVLPKHLPLYRTNMARGLTFYPPDILYNMLQEGKLGTDPDGTLRLLEQDASDKPPEEYPNVDSVSEFFDDNFSSDVSMSPPHVTASCKDFNFGRCARRGGVESLPLSLTNHTKGKVTVTWSCKPNSPFGVTPVCIEIPPLKSTALRLVFQPSQQNTLYSGELEGFIFYKVLRNYRNVEDVTLCPPWCITLQARGHTFDLGQEHFVPNCVLDSPRVVFPPVNQNVQTQRSLLLQNTGHSLMTFIVDQGSYPTIQVKPLSGHLAPGSHQVLLLRTSPKETRLTKHCLPLQLNYSPDYIQEIVLFSRAETPQLLLEGEGKLFFKPTCVGTQSECSYSLKNCSRLPLHFEWKIQHSDMPFISVSPLCGVIRPNETMAQTWSFVPQEETNYFVKTTVLTWAAEGGPVPLKKSRHILRISGEGCMGTISTEQEQVDLGNILVGTFQSCDLLLSNNGDCALDYALSTKQDITGPCDPDDVINDPIALDFEHDKGRLPARTKLRIKITARPARRLPYTWIISYRILTPKAVDPTNRATEKQALCCVTAQGVFPTFSIVDVCPAGSASSLNRTQLWRFFSLETLNAYLERDPTPGELIYRVPTRHSTRRSPSINTPVQLDFNFGAAPVGSEPFVALLLMENNGVLPAKWDFLYPADQQIELQFWAETWELNPSEIQQMRIQDNKLFTFSPKSGVLSPGQNQTVQLMYSHDFIGTHRLPVLLKVSHGREILIYELFNGGSVAVIYEIQLDPLKKIQEKNYHHPVFQCLNPRGEILPGSTAYVEWIFSPLEAKTYSVNVPVHILGEDSTLITFEGIGYDRNVLGEVAVFESFSSLVETQRLEIPGQVARLSMQCLNFGDLPVFCKCSRLLFLNNSSESEAVYFTWYAGSPNASDMLQVSPLSGVVQPGERAHITVTLQAGQQAVFFTLDLVCEIFMQKPLDEYERELLDWEEEEERQSVEFTINERARVPAKEASQPAGCGFASNGTGTVKFSSTELRRYKTLPPIKNAEVVHPPVSRDRARRRAEKEAQRIWARPEPPAPYQLHLSVIGSSHHTLDFSHCYQKDLPRHFLHRLPKERVDKPVLVDLQPETGEPEKCPGKPTREQQEIATEIMASIIRNLMDDKQFHEALEQIQSDPLPYFSQVVSQEKCQNTAGISDVAELILPEPQPDILEAEGEEEEERTISLVSPGKVVQEETDRNPQLTLHEKQNQELQKNVKRTPTFSHLVEFVLENTLKNILIEASRGEVVLTARPRVIALPPVTPRGTSPASTTTTTSMGQNVAPTSNITGQQDAPEGPGPAASSGSQ